MRRKALNLAGAALTVMSLWWLGVLLHSTPTTEQVQMRSWLPTATAHR